MQWIWEAESLKIQSEEGEILAELNFPQRDDKTVDISRTFVDESLRGQGIAGKMMLALAERLREKNMKATSSCSYAAKWFEKNTDYNDIMA